MLELCMLSNYASLDVTIVIEEEHIQMKKQTITRDSNEQAKFLNELGDRLGSFDTLYISNSIELEWITQELVTAVEEL